MHLDKITVKEKNNQIAEGLGSLLPQVYILVNVEDINRCLFTQMEM
jgi:hypothetical protein